MDLNERDDVPLAKLLRKGLLSSVEPSGTAAPVTSVHSHESSSSDEIFIPTPSHSLAKNVEVGQFGCFLPVRSSFRVDPSVDDQHSVPDPDPVGESTENLGGNFDNPANQNPADVDAHVEPTDTCASDNVESDVNVEPQSETQQSPGESRPKGKKFQQNQQNISIKAGRRKIPPNIPSFPIDGILFHLKESVQR
ncbi:uncharacterized protein E5676_scaffold994G00100 [Cucumis melo var. makuwa]|uniref:Envelope-like protein n=1 Tax=Cucumis melo var. makuwa TaxID=1194695 RepID=A0A5D3CE79_CUCMM|nr:uncharacterized protein E6C27_scaffold712G00160 [Cucumis melo var. makuwa]TYK09518.1 uncharacterized protein E5676_scaffold994G00100 [Cucumis melo var. makuwa]